MNIYHSDRNGIEIKDPASTLEGV